MSNQNRRATRHPEHVRAFHLFADLSLVRLRPLVLLFLVAALLLLIRQNVRCDPLVSSALTLLFGKLLLSLHLKLHVEHFLHLLGFLLAGFLASESFLGRELLVEAGLFGADLCELVLVTACRLGKMPLVTYVRYDLVLLGSPVVGLMGLPVENLGKAVFAQSLINLAAFSLNFGNQLLLPIFLSQLSQMLAFFLLQLPISLFSPQDLSFDSSTLLGFPVADLLSIIKLALIDRFILRANVDARRDMLVPRLTVDFFSSQTLIDFLQTLNISLAILFLSQAFLLCFALDLDHKLCFHLFSLLGKQIFLRLFLGLVSLVVGLNDGVPFLIRHRDMILPVVIEIISRLYWLGL